LAGRGTQPHPDESVGPLERGLTVLRAIAKAPGGRLRASELTRGTGLARSTVDRVAATLVELGYLRAEGDGRELVLAPAAATPGNAYLRACGLPLLLTEPAEELSARLEESVSLAVPDRESVRFIVQIKRRRALSVAFRVGDGLPAERCAPGALFAQDWSDDDFAAWRQRVRRDPDYDTFPALPTHRAQHDAVASFRHRIETAQRDGYAEDDQLIEQGLIAIAVPVRDADGTAVCALSVVSHASRHTVESLRETALPPLLETAARMTARLALPHRSPPPQARPSPAPGTSSRSPAASVSCPRSATARTA
jgi:IclR family pca regulon transcriptional regulator